MIAYIAYIRKKAQFFRDQAQKCPFMKAKPKTYDIRRRRKRKGLVLVFNSIGTISTIISIVVTSDSFESIIISVIRMSSPFLLVITRHGAKDDTSTWQKRSIEQTLTAKVTSKAVLGGMPMLTSMCHLT